jgi:hypothetical protein
MLRTSFCDLASLMYLAMPFFTSFLIRLRNLSDVVYLFEASLLIWLFRSSLSNLLAVSLLIDALAMLESVIPWWISSNFAMRSLAHLVGRSTASDITFVSSCSCRSG